MKEKFTVNQILSLLQNQKFFDWYCNGGDYDNWIQLGEDETGISEGQLKSWLSKELSKRKA